MVEAPTDKKRPAPMPKRKPSRCAGCGGETDGRHLDRALLQEVPRG